MRILPIVLLAIAPAVAQETKTFSLTHAQEPAVKAILKTIAGVTPGEDQPGITVTGTAADIALTTWLIEQLDTDHPTPGEYAIPGTSHVIHTAFLTHTQEPAALNEMVTSVRVNCDIQRIYNYQPLHAIIFRTSSSRAQMADWMLRQLDIAPNDPARFAAHEYHPSEFPDQTLKVVFLKHKTRQPANLNELLSSLRTIADIKKIFTHSSDPQGLVYFADNVNVRTADWLLQQFDTDQPAPAEYAVPGTGEVVHTAFLTHTLLNAAVNGLITSLRTNCDVKQIFTNTQLHGIVFRTTPSRAQMADWLIRQLDITPDDPQRFAEHGYHLPESPDQTLRVVFLKHPAPQANLNELVTAIRVVADMQKIFARTTEPAGLVYYADNAHVRTADWLIQQLDVEPDATLRAAQHAYPVPFSEGETARVYFLNPASDAAAMNELVTTIRSETNKPKMFICTGKTALAIRGTPEVIAIAERIVSQNR